MPFDVAWQRDDYVLSLSGHWMYDAVASVTSKVDIQGLTCINVQGVSGLDSSFMTLLLRLLANNQSLSLIGVSIEMMALMKLYGIDSFFQIESRCES